MGKKRRVTESSALPLTPERPSAALRRRRPLVLDRLLRDQVSRTKHEISDPEQAHQTIIRWADLAARGSLSKVERKTDAEFLNDIFGKVLGYKTRDHFPDHFHLDREFHVEGVGAADGALGHFEPDSTKLHALIELKGTETDLDRDRREGRTPVQQCWDYLNARDDCLWGIVSNYKSIRLYMREKSILAFEHFTLEELRGKERFYQFYTLFCRQNLLPSKVNRVPVTLKLVQDSDNRQREVGEELYKAYQSNRLALIAHLHERHGKTIDQAIAIAQKILDRIIFVAFCEDRALLPQETIARAYTELPPFAKVTNPRWQNFLELFRAVDEGHARLNLKDGYDGGLFRRDPEVDDLDLDDEWTHFFKEVAGYDFSQEVNVDVLGHLFEKSITELEKLRAGGLFESDAQEDIRKGRMPKSARRKRFGIYYTPVDLTRLIVQQTITPTIDERFAVIAEKHGLDQDAIDRQEDTAKVAEYARDCFDCLAKLTVCDPACGSGAFLIQAYDLLEDRYDRLIDMIDRHDSDAASVLAASVPDTILGKNLYGVDVSHEAIEITQLALWIRSARRGKQLTDISENTVTGNSIVTDPEVHARAMVWRDRFADLFARSGGFDCVIGNPPWERIKLQEREFFSLSAPDIAEAVRADQRKKLIEKLETQNPALFARYLSAKQSAEKTLSHVRASGNFPLTGKGDINWYPLFAELARSIVAPNGRVGLLVPSGIASDNTTKDFFAALMDHRALAALYDFENKAGLFPDVHRSFKFCTLLFGGSDRRYDRSDFVFFAREIDEIADRSRHVSISADDIALMNPNTRTCPIFRTQRDAELTKKIYRNVPVLVDESRKEGGNPWGIKFKTMFHQTNDAALFHPGDVLQKRGYKLDGNVWAKKTKRFLPLYEAKMVQMYDHRAAGVVIEKGNWMRQGQTVGTSTVSHQNAEFSVQPRWWVEEKAVLDALRSKGDHGLVGFKDITSPTNERTMIAAAIPRSGVTNHFPLVLSEASPRRTLCLLANLNSFVLDFACRQKIGGITLNFFIVKQLPILAPDAYEDKCPWSRRQTLEKWVSDRVLKLTCTANAMIPLAQACEFDPPVHKWKREERTGIMAELDAAYFLLYGLTRDDLAHVLSTFTGVRRSDEAEVGEFRTLKLILEAYDKLRGKM